MIISAADPCIGAFTAFRSAAPLTTAFCEFISFKYLLLVGVARQNPLYDQPISETEAEELAAVNAQIKPIMTLVVDEVFDEDYFIDLCIVLTEIMPTKFILTEEEKGITPLV